MSTHLSQLPKFNPVRAGFNVVPQGQGPNELMFNEFGQSASRGDVGPDFYGFGQAEGGEEKPFYKTPMGIGLMVGGGLLALWYMKRAGMLGELDGDCGCGG